MPSYSYITGLVLSETTKIQGSGYPRTWGMDEDKDGHRTYFIEFLVESGINDGPNIVRQTQGLPRKGSIWYFKADRDEKAWCTGEKKIRPHEEKAGDPTKIWSVICAFTTRPPNVCFDEELDDPLTAPVKISISSLKYSEEASFDMYGNPITNSSWELIRGPQVEFDKGRSVIRIEQNVASVDLDALEAARNTVNVSTMWGCKRRVVKLSDASAEKLYKGGIAMETGTGTGGCIVYWKRVLTFEAYRRIHPTDGSVYSGHDRVIADEGTKLLSGKWTAAGVYDTTLGPIGAAPDPNNPAHFIKAVDPEGRPARYLLRNGVPATSFSPAGTGTGIQAGEIYVEHYEESNFFALFPGLPTDLNSA